MALFVDSLIFAPLWLLSLSSAAVLPSASTTTQTPSDVLKTLQNSVTQQELFISQMQTRIALLETKVDPFVAFMVGFEQDQSLAIGQRVNFGTPQLNAGGGFHTSNDSFVAPVSGIYVFFLKIRGKQGDGNAHRYILLRLKLDGQDIAETEANDADNDDRASVQVIVHLTRGQSVWVEKALGQGTVVMGDGGIGTTLGGYLLRADTNVQLS